MSVFAQQEWWTIFAILFQDANALRVFKVTRFAETSDHATERATESLFSGARWWTGAAAGGKLFVNTAFHFWHSAGWRNGSSVRGRALRLRNATSFRVSDHAFFA
jgi:hypothetical protein